MIHDVYLTLATAVAVLAVDAGLGSQVVDLGSLRHSSIYVQPQQIHLSLGAEPHTMVVTWSTLNSTHISPAKGSYVLYGEDPWNMNNKQPAHETRFVGDGNLRLTQFIQRATLSGLRPNSTHFYTVGCDITLSNVHHFKTFPADDENSNWKPQIALYGDLGNTNGRSLPRLQRETQSGKYDMIIHAGDFAYDMNSENGRVGDEFMRQIEAIASYVPYMTCPGNHESASNFTHYKNRFTMPESREDRSDMFFSFNVGKVHFISISTEYYYFFEYGNDRATIQRNWLVKDLEKANSPKHREEHPWIIVFGHKPMYCDGWDTQCDDVKNPIKNGIPERGIEGIETLFYKHNVDVAFWAHEHNYERFWPVYDSKVMNGSMEEPYINPGAPLHIVAGSAGSNGYIDYFHLNKPYSAIRRTDYGYAVFKVHNNTHLELSQVSDDMDGEIIDHIWLVKDRTKKFHDYVPHGPLPLKNKKIVP